MRYMEFARSVLLVTAAALCLGMSLRAAEYKIGAEDALEVTFWQDNRLNKTVRVGQDGKITLDIIGQIDAAGKTTVELQNDIVRQISRLNSNISQAVVRVTEYNHNYVFVTGQARTPGKRTFEEIPDLWTIINEAGGASETGDLSRVAIIRGGEDAGKVEVVNVSAAIASGQVGKLPKIRRQDTIEIPRTPGGLTSPDLAQSQERRSVVFVYGAVNRPGPIEFQQNMDIAEVIAAAGGERADADLKRVRVLTKDNNFYSQSFQYDLEKYSKSGKPARYTMRKEDAFIVPAKRGGFLGLRLDVQTLATLATTTTTVILLIDRLGQNDRGTTVNVR
ncbi:MAG: polysaccharide biosynthesis/export family protein [Candidatus Zixiibacteriota bacterium]